MVSLGVVGFTVIDNQNKGAHSMSMQWALGSSVFKPFPGNESTTELVYTVRTGQQNSPSEDRQRLPGADTYVQGAVWDSTGWGDGDVTLSQGRLPGAVLQEYQSAISVCFSLINCKSSDLNCWSRRFLRCCSSKHTTT